MAQIDHVFVMVASLEAAAHKLTEQGLRETYRRQHPGQGTENVCFAFDNLFLELLTVNDPTDAQSPLIKRTGLYARSQWETKPTCPFGIAWREQKDTPNVSAPTWPFCPPYLPAGLSVPVLTSSDDPHEPFLFQGIGSTAPKDWPAERRGNLQHRAGLYDVTAMTLSLPKSITASEGLRSFATATDLTIHTSPDEKYGMQLQISDANGKSSAQLKLPACELVSCD